MLKVYLSVSVLLLLTISVEATDCPNGWLAYEGSCYLLGHKTLTFNDAVVFCSNQSAFVVHVETSMENNFLKYFLQEMNSYDYWIGMTDAVTENQWLWHGTDSEVEFFDWAPGEPHNLQNNEDCAVFGDTINEQWADVDCSSKRKPVCELKADYVPITEIIG
ncbi:C-type lectin domain 4 [Mactra antiquata]